MDARAPRRLSATLFLSIFAYSILAIACFAAAFSAFFYFSQESEEEARLLAIAESAARAMGDASVEQDVAALGSQFEEGIRYTLVGPDGSVLFDSEGEVSANHSDRPEIVQARQNGEGSVARHSETLGTDAVYAAVAMEGGNVLRLSEHRESYVAIAESIAFPLLATFVLVGVMSLALSRLLTARIVAPFDKIDVAEPMANQAYLEMEPLLRRINEQQRQLIEQNRELARAENLRREFSANVSHEMKTPLQVISGYAELMRDGVATEEDARRFAGIMSEESARMGALIDDVLTLSRIEDPLFENAGKENLELMGLVGQVVQRLLPLAEGREVLLRALGSSVEVVGNRQLLSQLFSNLVSNAIRYSDPGGEVTVMVGKTLMADGEVVSPEAFVKVKDDGCGIAPEEQDKIFERFYRVDKSRSKESGGTGLGLAIAKHAASFHGATITVDSAPGQGSVFTVRFPLE